MVWQIREEVFVKVTFEIRLDELVGVLEKQRHKEWSSVTGSCAGGTAWPLLLASGNVQDSDGGGVPSRGEVILGKASKD